jgi:hypothetical protein
VYEKWDHSRIVYSLILHNSDLLVGIDNTVCGHQLGLFISASDWLCRAIQTPQQGFLVSLSSCRVSQLDPKGKSVARRDPSEPGLCLSFSLFSEPLQGIQNNCWQKLFRSCFVLEEEDVFECLEPVGKGLEMSFDVMVCLAAAEYPVAIEGGLVLVGYHTVLAPTHIDKNYVQFHLEVNDEQQINPFDLDYGRRVQVLDYMQFKSMRCFVGWCESAQIKLGTEGLRDPVKYSGAQEKEKTLRFNGFSLGFQLVSASPIQAGVNGQANFSFSSHRLPFTPASDYSKMLCDTSKDVVLISDITARRSWLVSKLSLILHLAHAWVTEHGSSDPIPFAEPHHDGSVVAEALENKGDIVVRRQGNDSFKLHSLLLGFSINLLESVNRRAKSKGKSLYGFEFMDIVTEPGRGAFMKEIKIKTSQSWLALNLVDAVIVCSDLGEAIAPAEDDCRKNPNCNALPTGQDYLAAHLVCLDRLVSRAGGRLASLPQPSRATLSQGISWNISGEPFDKCTHENHSKETCWNKLSIFQKLCQDSFLRPMHSTQDQIGSPSSRGFGLKGAVVFGDRAWKSRK